MFKSRIRLPLIALATSITLPAAAQQFLGMEYDQRLNAALQEMLFNFGNACQMMGDPGSCGGYDYVMQAANYMAGASNACVMGNPDACQAYAWAMGDISIVYIQYSQAFGLEQAPIQDGSLGMVDPLGETHADRMDAIAQFGANNTAAFNQRMEQMDNNQAQWMSSQ